MIKMDWYKDLGYKSNPLEVDVFKTNFELLMYVEKAKELVYRLKAGNIVVIEGPAGCGKSTLLKEIIKEFGGKGKVIYVDNKKIGRNLNIEKLLVGNQSFWRKKTGKKPTGMILLLDNVNFLSEKNTERIKYFYDQDYLRGIVFTTDIYSKTKFSDSMRDRIGRRLIKLKSPSENDVVMITHARLNNDSLLESDTIRFIYSLSNKNLKKHLFNCQLVLNYLVENDKSEIKTSQIISIIQEQENVEEDLTQTCYKCNENLVHINNNWRCSKCENYCNKCGLIISADEEICYGCGANLEEEK